jgi:V-type H+-transporting ATPase subunit C
MGTFNPQQFGKDDGNFGPHSKRQSVKGSPVVPGSAVKIFSEGETHLYAVTILKGQYESGHFEENEFVQGKFINYVEPFKHACREKRFTAREFIFDPSKAGGLENQIEQAKWDVQSTLTTLLR